MSKPYDEHLFYSYGADMSPYSYLTGDDIRRNAQKSSFTHLAPFKEEDGTK